MTRAARAVALCLCIPSAAAVARADDGPLFAAVGVSALRDANAAAGRAAESMLAKFRARRRRPDAVIFLDRSGPRTAAAGRTLGDAVAATSRAPTYGTGGLTGTAGVTFRAKSDYEPTFLVLGLAGAKLAARAALVPAPIEPAGASARLARAATADTRLALLLGGLVGEVRGPLADGVRQALPAGAALLGIAGREGDYVYVDGKAAGGAMLLAIGGEFAVAPAGCASRNVADPEAVLAEADAVAARARAALGDGDPRVVLAFSDTGRLRTSGLRSPGKERARLRDAFGRAPIFGCFAAFQLGHDGLGRFSVGPGRLMLVALADRPADDGKED